MESINRIFSALGRLSDGFSTIYGRIFLIFAVLVILALLAGWLWIPRTKWRERKKRLFQKSGIITTLVVYLLTYVLVMFLTRDTAAGYQIDILPFDRLFVSPLTEGMLLHDIGGLFLFLPVGILFFCQMDGSQPVVKSMMFSLGMSLLTEFLQYVGKMGTFSIEDMIVQTLGGTLGALLAFSWIETRGRKNAGGIVLRTCFGLCVAFVFFGAAAFGTYHVLRLKGEQGMRQNISSVSLQMDSEEEQGEKGGSDLVWHEGKAYTFNDQTITILCMGIDQSSEEIQENDQVSGQSGQADSIFLVVMDPVKNQLKVIAVSRDTMTEIPSFDYKGNYIGESVNHLGLAYAYGNGKDTSCQYMVDAVSRLFYGIPVNGYAAFNMETIAALNDAVGGVTVTIPENEELTLAGEKMEPGSVVTLTGDMAESFVRYRDNTVHGSNNMRIARQKQFLTAFFRQAVDAIQKDVSLPVTLYQDFSSEMVTNIGLDNAVYLISEASKMSFGDDNLMIVQGEAKAGDVYDEFYVDEDALYQMILDTFYTEVTVE